MRQSVDSLHHGPAFDDLNPVADNPALHHLLQQPGRSGPFVNDVFARLSTACLSQQSSRPGEYLGSVYDPVGLQTGHKSRERFTAPHLDDGALWGFERSVHPAVGISRQSPTQHQKTGCCNEAVFDPSLQGSVPT